MTGLLHDVRSAVRLFRRDWRFSLTLVVTLATGIAATAIVFNVLNNTLLRPLPIPDEHRVYRLLDWTRGPDGRPLTRSTRVPNFLAIRDHARSFESVVGLRSLNFALDGGEAPVQVYVGLVSPGSFGLLGVSPVLGRVFTAAEEETGTDAGVMVLSHSLWQQQFGGRPEVVGTPVRIDGRPHTVVGVLESGFRFPYDVDAWIPERIAPQVEASVAALARLAPGVTPEQAARELDTIAMAMEAERPDTNRGLRYMMQPLREQLIGDQARITWSLFATAVLLLGLSCANVANLLLARGARRTREIAVQCAIGASRARQARQLVIESLVYCAAGTGAGVLLAALLGNSIMSLVPGPLRTQLGLGSVSFDWRVALFASAATALTAVVAGLVPARRLASTHPIEALRQQGRGSTGPRTLMQSLIVGEVALASVLLMASALMTDNLSRLMTADLGLDARDLSTIEITLPESRYAAAPARAAVVRALTESAGHVAGVQQAAIVTVNPLRRGSFGAAIETAERPLGPGEPGHIVNNRLVTAGWFDTAGVTLRQGRLFTAQDDERAPPVAIVSERMADRFWPGEDAVGKRIRVARPGAPWLTVVGVVGDVRDFGDWRETWYLPYVQQAATLAAGNLHLMLRSPLPPDVLGRAVQQALQTVDARLPVPIPTPMSALWTTGLEQQRLAASASALFGISGLLLAMIGTYGVLAYAVSARTREFGIRLALGAERRTVLLDVVRRGALLASLGLGAGVTAGLLVNRALSRVATESTGTPTHLIAAVVGVLAASALLASAIPALRATRIDPAEVMRLE